MKILEFLASLIPRKRIQFHIKGQPHVLEFSSYEDGIKWLATPARLKFFLSGELTIKIYRESDFIRNRKEQ